MNESMSQKSTASKYLAHIDLRPDCVIFTNGKVVFEIVQAPDVFWVDLGESIGFGEFCRFPTDANTLLLMRLQQDRTQVPYPIASIRGVLWSRRAAIEAEKSISAHLAGLAHLNQD